MVDGVQSERAEISAYWGNAMLTKRQTFWAVPVLILSFAALCLLGYVSEVILLGQNAAVTALLLPALLVNILALLFVFFSIFASLGTALIFNASSPQWWEATGNPFYYLLWKELQEATTRERQDEANRPM